MIYLTLAYDLRQPFENKGYGKFLANVPAAQWVTKKRRFERHFCQPLEAQITGSQLTTSAKLLFDCNLNEEFGFTEVNACNQQDSRTTAAKLVKELKKLPWGDRHLNAGTSKQNNKKNTDAFAPR